MFFQTNLHNGLEHYVIQIKSLSVSTSIHCIFSMELRRVAEVNFFERNSTRQITQSLQRQGSDPLPIAVTQNIPLD